MKVLEGLQAFVLFFFLGELFKSLKTEVSAKLTQLESSQINNNTPGGKIPEFYLEQLLSPGLTCHSTKAIADTQRLKVEPYYYSLHFITKRV